MQSNYEKKIQELHTFFEHWYRGSVENTDAVFKEIERVLAPEFTLITSSGHAIPRTQLLELFRTEYAAKPDIRIWVENCQHRFTQGEIAVVTYEEHGELEGRKKATLITAVLRKPGGQEDYVEWMHIHEVDLTP